MLALQYLVCEFDTMALHLQKKVSTRIIRRTQMDTHSNVSSTVATAFLFVLLFSEACTTRDNEVCAGTHAVVVCRCILQNKNEEV